METTENKTELKIGFKPDSFARKLLLNSWDTVAWLYPQGLVIREKKTLKQGKYSSQIEVYHIYPCKINLIRTNYKDTDSRPISRVVCHDGKTLLDGIKQVEYYSNNCSTAMEKRNLYCNTITIETLSGARHRSDDWPDLSLSYYTVQFGNEYSFESEMEAIKKHNDVIEYH
jgi:hypothetical protein